MGTPLEMTHLPTLTPCPMVLLATTEAPTSPGPAHNFVKETRANLHSHSGEAVLFSSFPPKSSNKGNAEVRRVESKEKEAKPRGRETARPGHRVCACLPQARGNGVPTATSHHPAAASAPQERSQESGSPLSLPHGSRRPPKNEVTLFALPMRGGTPPRNSPLLIIANNPPAPTLRLGKPTLCLPEPPPLAA